MPKISIDVETLRANEKSLEAKIQEMEQYNAELSGLIEQIHNSWDGKTSESYYNMMNGYHHQATTMKSVLNEFKKYVNAAANKFESMDQNAAARIRNSF